MKLFLASSLDRTLPLVEPLFSRVPKDMRVLFVANAADPYDKKWWIDLDRKKFAELGYRVIEIDLRALSVADFTLALANADLLHVCGGSVYYLVNLLRERGLDAVIIDAVKNGNVIYTGSSAGSIIISRSIAAFDCDEEEAEHIAKVPDKKGLGLADFVIVPHAGDDHFAEEHRKIMDHTADTPDPLIVLHNNQAVVVEDDTFRIVSM